MKQTHETYQYNVHIRQSKCCRCWVHHCLESAAWTSHQPALLTDRNRRRETLFVALHRHGSESTCCHPCRQALQWPCAVWKRFRRDHCLSRSRQI